MGVFSKFKENSKWGLLFHLLAIGIAGFVLLTLFFFVYLPMATSHGKTLPVPDVRGMSSEEAATALESHKLRYEVIDSTYDADLPPLAIVSQHPRSGEQVKSNRKIYLTTNFAQPPSIRLPNNMFNNSLKNAREQLATLDLLVGEVHESPYKFPGVVVSISVKGKKLSVADLEKGYMVKSGERIDLVVGDGEGKATSISEWEELVQETE